MKSKILSSSIVKSKIKKNKWTSICYYIEIRNEKKTQNKENTKDEGKYSEICCLNI